MENSEKQMNQKEIKELVLEINSEFKEMLKHFLTVNVLISRVTKGYLPGLNETIDTNQFGETFPTLQRFFLSIGMIVEAQMPATIILGFLTKDKNLKKMLGSINGNMDEIRPFLAPFLNKEKTMKDFVSEIQALQEIIDTARFNASNGTRLDVNEVRRKKFKHIKIVE